MKQQRNIRRKARGARFITTVSVTMVLTLLGIVALTGLVANSLTESLRSGIGVVVIVDDESPAPERKALDSLLRRLPEAKSVKYTSAETINAMMVKELGEEDLADINPFQSEYDIKMKPGHSTAPALKATAAKIAGMPGVYDVKAHTEMATSVNRTLNTVVAVLLTVAAALLIISFVLIFNTVSMETYAQRAVIHTMQYVGARTGFILRPYIIRSVVTGLIAGAAASALTWALAAWGASVYPAPATAIGWQPMAVVTGALMLTGAAVCALATWIAASRYLRRSYDKLYEK